MSPVSPRNLTSSPAFAAKRILTNSDRARKQRPLRSRRKSKAKIARLGNYGEIQCIRQQRRNGLIMIDESVVQFTVVLTRALKWSASILYTVTGNPYDNEKWLELIHDRHLLS